MSNNSENKEISPGLSLQNDFDQNQQNEENEKYTEPILETNKLDVKSRQRRHFNMVHCRDILLAESRGSSRFLST